MLKCGFVFLQLVLAGISFCGVNCLAPEEESAIMDALNPMVMDCLEECGLTEADLKQAKPGDMNPCIKKCVLKKLGLLTESGKYDRDEVRKQLIAVTETEEEANKIQAALDECFKGREEELKDDKEDIKRVDMIYQCMSKFSRK